MVPGKNSQIAPVPDAYSVQPGDNQNHVAQADGVAAHHAEGNQNLASASSKSRKAEDLAKIVAEENESRSKFPMYPGLDRWGLIEKMGDGAFSNVYRAKDLFGDAGEVAIKVVRKFEMNNMQVSVSGPGRRPKQSFPFLDSSVPFPSILKVQYIYFVPSYQRWSRAIGRQAFASGLQESSEGSRGARTSNFLTLNSLFISLHLS